MTFIDTAVTVRERHTSLAFCLFGLTVPLLADGLASDCWCDPPTCDDSFEPESLSPTSRLAKPATAESSGSIGRST